MSKRRTHTERKTTAVHEAAHAAIGRVLTLKCGGATIKPDYDEVTAGTAHTYDQWCCIDEWANRGRVRNVHAALHARIITVMAGAEAEREMLGRCSGGDGDDRYQIELMALELAPSTDWSKLEPRLRAMTRMLVRRHRARIERVAEALLARTTLSAGRLDKLVGRSVNDVKVNAPELLALIRARVADHG
jgi:hypothetical protein